MKRAWLACAMEIRQREAQVAFTTKDGSTIRSLLDRSNAPVVGQSLAEATLAAGSATDRHYHRHSEEFYYLLEGRAVMELDGEQREVGPGDAILIPAGAWHQIRALEALRFLCCCAPPYAHEDTYFL
jgi:mannose-6-phosphate isomerase-like protein (cupin superfamily)